METKQKFYIIGNYVYRDGLFSIYKHVCSHILYAVENGYIPVVDLKHYPNQYFKDSRDYKDNVWDYYFKQPAGVYLHDIDNSADILIADVKRWSRIKYRIYPFDIPLRKTNQIKPCIKGYNKYLQLSDEMKLHVDKVYKELFKDETEVLGIIIRGSDYAKLKPQGHLIQPKAKDVVKKARKLLNKFQYKKIYLATEDANIYKLFEEEFGEMLIKNPQYKYETIDTYLCDVKVNRKDHCYQLGKEYLTSVYLLSKCKYFIGGRANGTLGVYMMTNGFENFEYVYLWDCGRYGVSNWFITGIKNISNFVFSISNKTTKKGIKHKIITLFGIKFKLKIKG